MGGRREEIVTAAAATVAATATAARVTMAADIVVAEVLIMKIAEDGKCNNSGGGRFQDLW